MAKKKITGSATRSRSSAPAADELDLDAAEARLEAARDDLRKARELYEAAKRKAAESEDDLHEGSVGELLDTGLNFVKKYPTLGVFAATAFGFFLGRLFRK